MTLTIDLTPELEAQLREEAASKGIDTDTFVVRTLEERLRRKSPARAPASLTKKEATLLKQINEGLPEAIWEEYHDLIAKRRAETLTAEEHTRLIELSDSIEDAYVQKLEYIAELAKQRHVPLKTLMEQMGIKPRKV